MKLLRQICGLATLMAASAGLAAAGLDTSTRMLCAVTHTVTCDALGGCIDGPAEAINLPVFFRIDPLQKVATSVMSGGEQRSSNILSVNAQDTGLAMLGTDAGGAWSAFIDKATGKMTVTAAQGSDGYLVFGSCIAE
jgi:hypothetical protein